MVVMDCYKLLHCNTVLIGVQVISNSSPVAGCLPCTTSSVQIEQCPLNAYKNTEHIKYFNDAMVYQ